MERLLGALGSVVPPAAVELMRDSVRRLVTRQRSGFFSVGLVVTLWAASNAADAIVQGLNRVHGLREPRPFWKTRGIAHAAGRGRRRCWRCWVCWCCGSDRR